MPDATAFLIVSPSLAIPRAELTYRATRAGGAGGQHVNTSSTRIELLWDLRGSQAVTEDQRERLVLKLGPRMNAEGQVRVVASERRSQQQNRKAAEERLGAVIQAALAVRRKRKATRPGKAAVARRLDEKRRRAERKRERRGGSDQE
jgi:ribosome-associated protein